MTVISVNMFVGCTSLETVTIGSSVTSIEKFAFSGCTALKTVYYDGTAAEWATITIGESNDSLLNAAVIIASGEYGQDIIWTLDKDGVLTISGEGDIIVPESFMPPWSEYSESITSAVIGSGVTNVGYRAFYGCGNLTEVTIPDSVTKIEDEAFFGCGSLESVDIPAGVTTIGNFAFYNCSGLTNVTIRGAVTSIGTSAFYGCAGLTSFDIPDSIETISMGMFYGCTGLTSIEIPDSVTSLGEEAFRESGLTSVEIPDSVKSIGARAFYGCNGLTGIVIPDTVTSLGESAFSCCKNLTSATIGGGVTVIEKELFRWCEKLEKVTFREGVEVIGEGALTDCVSLTEVEIPVSVTEIHDYVFAYCPELETVCYAGSKAQWNAISQGEGNGFEWRTIVCLGDPITSGTYDYDPSEKIAEGYVATAFTNKNGETNWIVTLDYSGITVEDIENTGWFDVEDDGSGFIMMPAGGVVTLKFTSDVSFLGKGVGAFSTTYNPGISEKLERTEYDITFTFHSDLFHLGFFNFQVKEKADDGTMVTIFELPITVLITAHQVTFMNGGEVYA